MKTRRDTISSLMRIGREGRGMDRRISITKRITKATSMGRITLRI
jgi:hypothetical protein